jgi:hypothetical protein
MKNQAKVTQTKQHQTSQGQHLVMSREEVLNLMEDLFIEAIHGDDGFYRNYDSFDDYISKNLPQSKPEPTEQEIEEAAENYSEGWGSNDDFLSFKAGIEWYKQQLK